MFRKYSYYVVLPLTMILLVTLTFVTVKSDDESAVARSFDEPFNGQDDPIEVNDEIDREKRNAKGGSEKEVKKPKSKKRESRRKIAISAVEKIVEEKLQEQLQPLNTALKIVRLDAFSEGILRQLSNLEHIQSKLLTEYGELRAAVTEVGRHTLDLGRQVAGLDERLATLDRQLPHRMDIAGARNDFRSENNPRPTNPFTDISPTAEMLKDALVSITTKISGSERRFKDDLTLLGNRTTEAVRSSQAFLERRIAEVASDTEQVLISFEKLVNKSSCLSSIMASTSPSESPEPRLLSNSDRFFRRPSSLTHSSHLKITSPEGSREDLVYLPAEERSLNTGRLEREERQHPPLITPFTSWARPVSEIQSLNVGTVSRLASEIAKYMMQDGQFPEARDCTDISTKGEKKSGVYTIYPASCSRRFAVKVWCEMDDSDGGWTVLQRRGPWELTFPSSSISSSSSSLSSASSSSLSSASSFTESSSGTFPSSSNPVEFFRDWAEYKWGFGDLQGEYWLGNEYIHQLTQSGDYDLRIELYDWTSDVRWAQYSHFYIDDEAHNYTLHIGEYTGNAGNSLKHHQGVPFSTRDRDNDQNPRGHCARTFHGAWWFTSCHEAHLNGRYHKGRHKSYGDGINWLAFKGHNYSLKKTRMMIRPTEKKV